MNPQKNSGPPWRAGELSKSQLREYAAPSAVAFAGSLAFNAAFALLGPGLSSVIAAAVAGSVAADPLMRAARDAYRVRGAANKARLFAKALPLYASKDFNLLAGAAAGKIAKALPQSLRAKAQAAAERVERKMLLADGAIEALYERTLDGEFGHINETGAFDLACAAIKSGDPAKALDIFDARPFDPNSDATADFTRFYSFYGNIRVVQGQLLLQNPNDGPLTPEQLKKVTFIQAVQHLADPAVNILMRIKTPEETAALLERIDALNALAESACLSCHLPETQKPGRAPQSPPKPKGL